MSDEIVDKAFAAVTDAVEAEYSSAKTAAENGVTSAKEKALSQLKT